MLCVCLVLVNYYHLTATEPIKAHVFIENTDNVVIKSMFEIQTLNRTWLFKTNWKFPFEFARNFDLGIRLKIEIWIWKIDDRSMHENPQSQNGSFRFVYTAKMVKRAGTLPSNENSFRKSNRRKIDASLVFFIALNLALVFINNNMRSTQSNHYYYVGNIKGKYFFSSTL